MSAESGVTSPGDVRSQGDAHPHGSMRRHASAPSHVHGPAHVEAAVHSQTVTDPADEQRYEKMLATINNDKSNVNTHYNDEYKLTDGERYARLIKKILQDKHDNFCWGGQLSNRLLWWSTLATIFAACAFILAALPDTLNIYGSHKIEKWMVALPAAISGACFLYLRQMKFGERANAHYHKHDMMQSLYMELICEADKPPSSYDICRGSAKYREYVTKSGEVFARINASFGTHQKGG